MNKKLRTVSAIALTLCTAAGILSACGEEKTDITTAASTAASTEEKVTVVESDVAYEIVSQNEQYTYYKPATKSTEAFSYQLAPPPTKIPTTSYKPVEIDTLTKGNESVEESGDKTTEKTTVKANSDATYETIEEKSKGISIVTKSTPVMSGNTATIMIQGTPNKNYSIDFYESSSKKADYSGLETKKADSNGFVTWTFEIESSCEPGNRKIYIKESNSSNYLQTSITVNN